MEKEDDRILHLKKAEPKKKGSAFFATCFRIENGLRNDRESSIINYTFLPKNKGISISKR